MKTKKLLFLAFSSFIISLMTISCAQVVAPTGGKKDTLAPKVVKTIPANQSINFNGKVIELTFDEYVSVENIQQQLLITPGIEEMYIPKINPKGARLTFNKPLKPNTTYSFNFRNSFKDITERNAAKNVKIVFSTGSSIDSLKISGTIKNPAKNQPVLDALVGLYYVSDTLKPSKVKPYYFTKTDSAGKFSIENIAPARYRIFALSDINNNLLYEDGKESIGFIKDEIDLKSNISDLKIDMSKIERQPNKVIKTRATSNYYFIEYARGIKSARFEYQNAKDSLVFQQMEPRQIRLFNINNNSTDTIKVKITLTDSLEKTFTHEQKVKFRTKNKKEDGVRDKYEIKVEPANLSDVELAEIGIKIKFTKPTVKTDFTKIQLLADTITPVNLSKENYTWNADKTELTIKSNKKVKQGFKLSIPKQTFFSVENDTAAAIKNYYTIRDPEKYGIISGTITNAAKRDFIVQLLDPNFEVKYELKNKENYQFEFVKAGTYLIRVIVDENKNGKWDFGDLDTYTLPEPILYIQDKVKLKQNFELTGFNFKIE